jgi:hypothetical protein
MNHTNAPTTGNDKDRQDVEGGCFCGVTREPEKLVVREYLHVLSGVCRWSAGLKL